ncbi:MAG: hypothetical protein R3C32_05285 [Chloroflexota bacterium]
MRLRIDQLSAVERDRRGRRARVRMRQPLITAGAGRPLIVTSLAPAEAMRVLAAEHRGRVRLATLLLVGGLVAGVAGLMALVEACGGTPAREGTRAHAAALLLDQPMRSDRWAPTSPPRSRRPAPGRRCPWPPPHPWSGAADCAMAAARASWFAARHRARRGSCCHHRRGHARGAPGDAIAGA